jgi:2-haloacid dehalogenase
LPAAGPDAAVAEDDCAQVMPEVRALAFDVFGTLVDWRSGIAGAAAAQGLPGAAFADAWRARYVPSMDAVRRGELPWLNLDALQKRSLDELLPEFGAAALDVEARGRLVLAWHRLPPWPDTVPGLVRMKQRYLLSPLSNGGFALLTNLARQAGLPFDCILSAELCRHYKPDPETYRMAADLLGLRPAEVMMVAAHKSDLRAAQAAGLGAAFVERPLEFGARGGGDRLPDPDSDVAAGDLLELASQLGC